MNYADLKHTGKLGLRTFVQKYPVSDYREGGKIQSSGSYRIGLYWNAEEFTVTDQVLISINGGPGFLLFSVPGAPMGGVPGVINIPGIYWMDGDVNTVRDDIIEFTFGTQTNLASELWVFFDRVGEKLDDTSYPPQNEAGKMQKYVKEK